VPINRAPGAAAQLSIKGIQHDRVNFVFRCGFHHRIAGRATRNQAWADERVWQPSDLKNGKLDPWTLKGLGFNTLLAIPELAVVAGTAVGGTALGGPGGGIVWI